MKLSLIFVRFDGSCCFTRGTFSGPYRLECGMIPCTGLFSVLHLAFLRFRCSFLRRIPLIRKALARLVPVANYWENLPLTRDQTLDWAVLNIFDWLPPRFEKTHRLQTIKRWFAQAQLGEVEVGFVAEGEMGQRECLRR